MTISPSTGASGAAPESPRPPLRTWDLVLSIVLLALNAGLALLLLMLAPFLVMASDPCGSGTQCNTDQMGVGIGIAFLGPLVMLGLGIAGAVVLLILRKPAFWVPIVSLVLTVGVFLFGAALVISGVPGATF
jgi:hypothetical protein